MPRLIAVGFAAIVVLAPALARADPGIFFPSEISPGYNAYLYHGAASQNYSNTVAFAMSFAPNGWQAATDNSMNNTYIVASDGWLQRSFVVWMTYQVNNVGHDWVYVWFAMSDYDGSFNMNGQGNGNNTVVRYCCFPYDGAHVLQFYFDASSRSPSMYWDGNPQDPDFRYDTGQGPFQVWLSANSWLFGRDTDGYNNYYGIDPSLASPKGVAIRSMFLSGDQGGIFEQIGGVNVRPFYFAQNVGSDNYPNDWWGYAYTDASVQIQDIDCGGC